MKGESLIDCRRRPAGSGGEAEGAEAGGEGDGEEVGAHAGLGARQQPVRLVEELPQHRARRRRRRRRRVFRSAATAGP